MGANREFPRKQLRISTAIQVFDARNLDRGFYLTRDIGTGGLFLQMSELWPLGSEQHLIIRDQGVDIECAAKVVRVTSDGVGMQFLSSSEGFKRAVMTLIQGRFASGDRFADRRKVNRWVISVPVLIRVGIGESPGTLVNVNMQGALIEGAESPPSAVASVMVILPMGPAPSENGDPPAELTLGCQARIIHRQPDGFGVEFVEPSAEFHFALSELIARADEGDSD